MGVCDSSLYDSFQVFCVYEIGNEEQKGFIDEIKNYIENHIRNLKRCDYQICEYNEFQMKIIYKDRRHLTEKVIYKGIPNIHNPEDINGIETIKNLIRNKTENNFFP